MVFVFFLVSKEFVWVVVVCLVFIERLFFFVFDVFDVGRFGLVWVLVF